MSVDEDVDWTVWERSMARPFRWEKPPSRARRWARNAAVFAALGVVSCLVSLRLMR